jgi:hypothetical protein
VLTVDKGLTGLFMRRLNLRIDTLALHTIWCVLLLAASANAANLTVKSGGGGNYTTIQSCATAMSPGDTCTVYAGTYNENVTVSAGSVGNYKTITVNGSDVVSVRGFILNSHTQLIGNCPTLQGTVIIPTCGFFISNPLSPSSAACVSLPNGTTDVYITSNVMYACGSGAMISATNNATGASYIYVQGNTLSYACVTQAQAGTSAKECNGIQLGGSHFLVENNDLSHYTLGIWFSDASYVVIRNNAPHDQYETEAGGNAHTDAFYASSDTGANHILIEGNNQYTGVGPNAKGLLTQGEFSPCNGTCSSGLIYRFNSVANIGSGNTSTYGWNHQVMYNNTYVNVGNLCGGSCYGGVDNFLTDTYPTTYSADLNNISYFSFSVPTSGMANPTAFDSSSAATGVSSHNLAYCNTSGASNCSPFGQVYEQGSWTGVPGNILGYVDHVPSNNPNFANLAGNDFHLQAGSSAIGAGTYLTTVAPSDSGSGTSLVVNDASYFQDGYGLSNASSTVHPDCIAFGTASNHVCVTAVNYATNTLTLASSISRSVGEGVYLYSKSDGVQVLTGNAPDLGAYPYGSGTNPPAPPSSLAAVVQ